MRRRITHASLLRREASRNGRKAIQSIQLACNLQHEAELWRELAVKAGIDPHTTNMGHYLALAERAESNAAHHARAAAGFARQSLEAPV